SNPALTRLYMLRENGRNSTARILNFHLARNPEIAFLWNMADNYSNLLNPEMSISCPFILTLTLVVEDQVKTHSEANLKYMGQFKITTETRSADSDD
ncbi:hypothetical protein KCQ64_29230, partial [Klebsiella pneumoniae]|nr:hypothetical protein [Klebsiella pneumoniae]